MLKSASNLAMAPIVIFGGTGFLGSALASKFSSQGREVHVFGRFVEGQELMGEPSFLSTILQNFNKAIVVFAIGNTRTAPKGLPQDVHHQLKSSILCARKELLNSPRILHLGSSEEYGFSEAPFRESDSLGPAGEYGKAKLLESEIFSSLRAEGGQVSILRPTSVFGPMQNESMFVGHIVKTVRSGTQLTLEHPSDRRDYLYVEDFVCAVDLCVGAAKLPPTLNIGSNEVLSRLEFIRVVENFVGAPLVAKIGKDRASPMNNLVDTELIRSTLKWRPRWTVESGVAEMLKTEQA